MINYKYKVFNYGGVIIPLDNIKYITFTKKPGYVIIILKFTKGSYNITDEFSFKLTPELEHYIEELYNI